MSQVLWPLRFRDWNPDPGGEHRAMLKWCIGLLCLVCSHGGLVAEELRVLTWNVLAAPEDAVARGQALRDTIVAARADIVCLQEVDTWFLTQLRADRRLAGYRQTVIGGSVQAPGGCFVLSRWPFTAEVGVIPSRMNRIALLAEIAHPQGDLRVAVVHLDSLIGEAWQAVRSQQLVDCGKRLADATHALLVGDMNFGDGEPEAASIPAGFLDAWRTVLPQDPGLTWVRERNALADANSFPNEANRRLDRLLMNSPNWQAQHAALVGTAMYNGEWQPSDHFGVVATWQFRATP
jgi:endonuclease/exonuclease/phosphatase family metal-dependent hydrolase